MRLGESIIVLREGQGKTLYGVHYSLGPNCPTFADHIHKKSEANYTQKQETGGTRCLPCLWHEGISDRETLGAVLRYTRSLNSEDRLKLYRGLEASR